MQGSGRQAGRKPDPQTAPRPGRQMKSYMASKWETNEKKWETSQPGTRPAPRETEKEWETNERKWETSPTTSTEPGRQMKGSGRQASREPDHKHPAWETNEKKWETSRPGTRPQAPSLGDK